MKDISNFGFVAALGGNANNSVKAGAFYVNSNNSSANDNSNIGSRLSLWIRKKLIQSCFASWQNTKQSLITVWYRKGRTGGEISR
jgi:hypothetical protein